MGAKREGDHGGRTARSAGRCDAREELPAVKVIGGGRLGCGNPSDVAPPRQYTNGSIRRVRAAYAAYPG